MEISLVDKNGIKLKGKKVSFITDSVTTDASADAILFSRSLGSDKFHVPDGTVVISGPGEYEINGSKISAVLTPKGILYKLSIDNIAIMLGRVVDFSKLEGNFTSCEAAVLNVDGDFNESFVTSLTPKVVVLYGAEKLDSAKKLGTQNLSGVTRFSVAKDKLPEKMEVIVLG